MRHIKHILFTVIALFMVVLLEGCTSVGKMSVSDLRLESVSPLGFRSMLVRVGAWVENPSREVVFSELEGVVYVDGKIVGNILADPVVVAGNSSEKVSVNAELRLDPGMTAVDVLRVVATPDILNKCTVDVHAKAKQRHKAAFVVNKKGMPLNRFLGMIRR